MSGAEQTKRRHRKLGESSKARFAAINIRMRYAEIIEKRGAPSSRTAEEVWKQTEKSHEALRKLRSKEQDAADKRASALALPAGPERSRRLQSADRRDANARQAYGTALSKANAARAKALANAPS